MFHAKDNTFTGFCWKLWPSISIIPCLIGFYRIYVHQKWKNRDINIFFLIFMFEYLSLEFWNVFKVYLYKGINLWTFITVGSINFELKNSLCTSCLKTYRHDLRQVWTIIVIKPLVGYASWHTSLCLERIYQLFLDILPITLDMQLLK